MVYLEGPNWEPGVKNSINELIDLCGACSNSKLRPYAVFDFDNTTSINDVHEQLLIWQIDHLAFEIPPDRIADVLKTGILKEGLKITYGADNGRGIPVKIGDVIDDVAAAYCKLSEADLLNANNVDSLKRLRLSEDYLEFSSKMRWLYDAITRCFSGKTSYTWAPNWYTGMTPDQVYSMAVSSHLHYKGGQPSRGRYIGPEDYKSKTGKISVSYKVGITVAPEIYELYSAFDANGIDVYIVSASPYDIVRAAIDVFDLPGIDGLFAIRNMVNQDGTFRNACDESMHALPQGEGKCDTIDQMIAPKYQGRGPIFCAIDSQGDFNFGTEYKDTNMVLVLNRARLNDVAICTAVSVYQKQRDIQMNDTVKSGDTLYLLQGRNENEGVFWPNNSMIKLGESTPILLTEPAIRILEDLNSDTAIASVFAKYTRLKESYTGYKTR